MSQPQSMIKALLAKCLTLLYRETQVPDLGDKSNDLVRTTMEKVVIPEVSIGQSAQREMIYALKNMVLELCNRADDDELDLQDMLQRIRIITEHDEMMFSAIRKSLEETLTDGPCRRSITIIRKYIHQWSKDQLVGETIRKFNNQWSFQRDTIPNTSEFISKMLAELEPLAVVTTAKDPAVISMVNFSLKAETTEVFGQVSEELEGSRTYKTLWKRFDRMLQGGMSVGLNNSCALQHNYKSGEGLSVFAMQCMANKPYTQIPNKKPLAIHISFENKMNNNLLFLYLFLKYSEDRVPIDVHQLSKTVTKEEMSEFVMSRLTMNGFSVMMMQVDPSNWSYRSFFNKILELEAEGYMVELCTTDYLNMMSKAGCASGTAGEDIRDLMRRVRTFYLMKGICGHNMHQMSTEAIGLLKSGTPDYALVKEVANRSYYDGSKRLGQEFDIEIWMHIVKHLGRTYLNIGRGKDRKATVIKNESWKYFLYEMPDCGMPIPYDLPDETMAGFDKLPSSISGSSGVDIF